MGIEMQKAPVALSKPKPTGQEILELGLYLVEYRKEYGLTQRQASKLLGLSYRRLQTYEATAGWNESNREQVRAFPGLFDFTATITLARQGWSSQRSLAAAMDRVIEGKAPRKRYQRGDKSSASDHAAALDRLRERYGTKVLIGAEAISFHHYGNSEILEMLIHKLLEPGTR